MKYIEKTIIIIALIASSGGIIYKLYQLNWAGVILTLLISVFLFLIIEKQKNKKQLKLENNKINIDSLPALPTTLYLIFYFLIFGLIFKARTGEAIISPWQTINQGIFILFFIENIILFHALRKVQNKIGLLFLSLQALLAFSVASIVYKFGYGFDPFIHRATENFINDFGQASPKPFYYLGQYGLVVTLHKITQIPIYFLDNFLTPLLAALTLPYAFYSFAKNNFSCQKCINFSILLLLIMPFSIFIISTPQNLAFIFLILLVLFSFKCENWHDLKILYLLALATFISHPIAGIPAICYLAAIHIYHSDSKRLKKPLLALLFIFSSLALPFAFYLFNKSSGSFILKSSNLYAFLKNILILQIPHTENSILNLNYLYFFNTKLIIALLILLGIFIFLKNKQKLQKMSLPLFMSLSMFLSFFFNKKISFDFLINYEQDNYSQRIIIIAIIFSLPFIFLSIQWFVERAKNSPKRIQFILIIACAYLMTASFYSSYPKLDNLFNSHGYSVSQNDIEAVRWIENDSRNKDYIVLANQQTSVASLQEFGFKKYYKNKNEDIFYYPIPTGGALYQKYLDMVYKKASAKTMNEAMKIAGVDTSYFIISKYWWASDRIIKEARTNADLEHEINKEIFIFKYHQSRPSSTQYPNQQKQ